MKTLDEFLHWAADEFTAADIYYGHGTDNAWDEAVMIALKVLELPADADQDTLQLELNREQQQQFKSYVKERVATRKPMPYILQEAWYAGERYIVSEDVLVPRSPIAEIVINKFKPYYQANKVNKILDMCTGSGCTAIHCSKIFPEAMVTAVDISTAALEIAAQNIKLHAKEDKVRLVNSDMFTNLNPADKFDIIVSNPPYVGDIEMGELPPEYTHEPKMALQSGTDGLQHVKTILAQAANFLEEHGILVVEVGNTSELLEAEFPLLNFQWVELHHGGHGVFVLTAEDLKRYGK